MIQTVFLSHDGILENLGQSQILGYQIPLSDNVKINLFSFEKKSDLGDRKKIKTAQKIKKCGINWHPRPYRNFPPKIAQVLSMAQLAAELFIFIRRNPVDLFHVRGYPCMLACLLADPFGKVKKVFDMRGFWPDEKVNAGHWKKNSLIYFLAKQVEKMSLCFSDHIVCLTRAAKKTLEGYGIPSRKLTYIPTCVDLKKFTPRKLSGRIKNPIFCFSGNISGWYNQDEMLKSARILLQEFASARLLILTKEPKENLLGKISCLGISHGRITIRDVEFDGMPQALRSASFGIFLNRPAFSEIGRSPTKLGEFLACGVPVITNDGIGDCSQIIRREKVGLVLQQPTAASLAEHLPRIRAILQDPLCPKRCRSAAEKVFDLERGVYKYYSIYRRLVKSDQERQKYL